MGIRDTINSLTSDPRAKTAGEHYKKLETGLWKVLDPIGKTSNKIAGRLGAEAFWPTELAEGEIDKAARILRTFSIQGARADQGDQAEASGGVFPGGGGGGSSNNNNNNSGHSTWTDPNDHRKTQKVLRKIPESAIQGACGIAIFSCFRTGLGWSGAGGSGVVLARLPDGSWGPPSGLLVHTLGWGLLVGLDIYDVVLVIRRPETLKAFTHPKVSVGGELSVAAGPVGNGAMLDSGLEAQPVWSYSKSKGAYMGLQLDGTIILKRDDANARFYGQKVSVADIFEGRVRAPAAAKPLMQTLYAAEGRPDFLGTDAIPQGLTPGDIPVSEADFKTANAQVGPGGHGTGMHEGAAGAAVASTMYSKPDKVSDMAHHIGEQGDAGDVPPPSYDAFGATDGPYQPPPPPPASHEGPRDAVAEKEALRRQYAQQDAAGSATSATATTAASPEVGESTSQITGVAASQHSHPYQSHPHTVQATYDFHGVESGDMTFRAGETIEVTGMEGEQWYRGRITVNGQTRSGSKYWPFFGYLSSRESSPRTM